MKIAGENVVRFVPALAILYLAIVVILLLYPFNFSSPFTSRENSVTWPNNGPDNAQGVRFGDSGMLVSDGPPMSLFKKLRSGKGLSVELWLSTALPEQFGPARILTYSLNPWEWSFTVGQQRNDLVFRLTTTDDGPNTEVEDAFVSGRLQHIVVTYDFSQMRLYVDGRRVETAMRGGGFDTWDPTCLLVFGNEASGGRPWDGTIAFAAIYDRPLDDAAIAARYDAGYKAESRTAGRARDAGLVLAYDFGRDGNDRARPLGPAATASSMPVLKTPARVPSAARLFFLRFGGKTLYGVTSAWDLIRNVILFLPFGVLGFALLWRRTGSITAVAITVLGAGLFSATCEALQFFLVSRTSSILDVATNATGALLGAAVCAWWVGRIPRGRAATR